MQSPHLGNSAYPSAPLRRHNLALARSQSSHSPGILHNYGTSASLIHSFQRAQNKLFKLVPLNSTPKSTYCPKQLHRLPIHNRIIFKIALMTYRTPATSNPTYLHHLNLRIWSSFTFSYANKSSFVYRGFSYASAPVWNALPYLVRAQPSPLLKLSPKTHLFGTPT